MAGTKCADIIGGIAPSVRAILVKEVTAGNELVVGARPQVRFDELIDLTDAHGRYAHLLGFRVEYGTTVDTVAATMAAAQSGRLMLAAMNNIQMSAGGRNLFRGTFDARRLDDDMVATFFGNPEPLPTDIPDADGTDVASAVTLEYMFGSARIDRWRRDLRDGGIPMSMLQSRMRATDILQWQWSDAFLEAGVTGLVISSFRVWGIVGYWEQPTISPLSFLDEVESNVGQVTLEREYRDMPGVVQYIYNRPIETDTDGLDSSTLDQVTVRCGGDTLASGESAVERISAQTALLAAEGIQIARPILATGVVTQLALQVLPMPVMVAAPSSKRSDMGDGPVLVDVQDLGSQTTLRLLMKSYTEPPEGWVATAFERFGFDLKDPAVRERFQLTASKATPGRTVTDIAPGLLEQRLEPKGA